MSTPLTNYLTTSNPTVHQFLEQIQFTPNGLVYQDILINTNQNQPVTYIGATNRERTRRKQLQEIASNITKTKQEKETNYISQCVNDGILRAPEHRHTLEALAEDQRYFQQKAQQLKDALEKQP